VDGVTLTPSFVSFLRKPRRSVSRSTLAIRPTRTSPTPCKSVQSDGIESAVLNLDGQQISYSG